MSCANFSRESPRSKIDRFGAIPEATRHRERLGGELEQTHGAVGGLAGGGGAAEIRLQPAWVERVDGNRALQVSGIRNRKAVEQELAQPVGGHVRLLTHRG